MNRSYISSGKGMDSHMDYPLVDALIRYFKYEDVTKLRYIIQDMLNEYPKGSIDTIMNFTSTHDISRPINIFGSKEFSEYSEWAWNVIHEDYNYLNNYQMTQEEYEKGKEIFMTYLFCLNFMPGILSIFYGDEAAVMGLGNLLNRQPYPWDKRSERLVHFVKMLGQIRKDEEFLKTADMNIVDINHDYFMFERTSKDGDALITINRTPDEKKILIPSLGNFTQSWPTSSFIFFAFSAEI
jgi:glycosidase